MNKKVIFGVISTTVIAAMLVFSGCGGKTKTQESGKVKIGVILPLTGDVAFMGEMFKNAMLMNLDTAKTELFIEDSKGEPKSAVTIVNNLINVRKCNVIVSFLPPVSESINPICENKNIIHFVFAFSPNITESKNVIKQFPSSDYESSEFIKYIKAKNVKTVVFFRHKYPDAELAYNTIAKPSLEKEHIKAVDISYEMSETNFKNIVLKAKSEKPDLIVVQSLSINYRNILTTFKENKINNLLLDLNCVDFLNNDADKTMMNDLPFVGLNFILLSEYKKFEEDYFSLYNSIPYVFGAFPYDLMFVLNNLKESGLEKEQIIKYYNENTIKGVTGRIQYDNKGNQTLDYTIMKYSNGIAHKAE